MLVVFTSGVKWGEIKLNNSKTAVVAGKTISMMAF